MIYMRDTILDGWWAHWSLRVCSLSFTIGIKWIQLWVTVMKAWIVTSDHAMTKQNRLYWYHRQCIPIRQIIVKHDNSKTYNSATDMNRKFTKVRDKMVVSATKRQDSLSWCKIQLEHVIKIMMQQCQYVKSSQSSNL